MRRFVLVAVVFVLVGLAPASADLPGVVLDESFENGTDVFSQGAWGMEPLADGHDGPGLRSIIPSGEHWGSSGHWYFSDHGLEEPEELWWRYWVKFPEGFYIEVPNRGKLPGVAGLYTYNCLGGRPSTPEEPCFSARMLFSRIYGEPGNPNGPDDQTLLGYYAYHLDSPDTRGDIWTWDPEVAALDHGSWYCVEGHIDLNTPGTHNGTLEGWVDEQAAFSRDGIAFRRAGESDINIKSFWFDIYYGGGESLVDNEIHFDSLAFGSQRIGCDDGGIFEPPFRDDETSTFQGDINWLAAAGITQGCNPPVNDRFCPSEPVTRGQMAAFLSRALSLPAGPGANTFSDDDTSQFESAIESLAAARITLGCNPPANDRFCPSEPVTRGQMAAFLSRALGYADPGTDTFLDDDGSVFESSIEALASAGVTRGCNPPDNDRFCHTTNVTRGQMAAFLHRAVGS
ncbi:MAG: S-layer homology domain-containing protein [bacterium]|nr:S-layer homology domain-containing protein [bacterium]